MEYKEHFCQSKWFTRGWTLQELLAPPQLIFYARDWSEIASAPALASIISSTTKIDSIYLQGSESSPLSKASAAQKMAWLSHRVTTRVEDMAYCMLGIFDINMPLLYGEGAKAFIRLQEEIIRVSNDHTIFCWTWVPSVPKDWVSRLFPVHVKVTCFQEERYSSNVLHMLSFRPSPNGTRRKGIEKHQRFHTEFLLIVVTHIGQLPGARP